MDEVNFALLLVRVVVGVTLALHGVQKVRGGLDGVARWFDGMGMRPGWMHARFAAFGEIAAGLCIAVGLLTTFGALGFVGLMSVAGWTDHRDKGFFILKQGWEYVMVLAVVAVTIAMLGPGEWSVDHALGIDDDLDGYVGLLISAGGGLTAAVGLLAVFYRPPTAAD
jgi:putative oxidoreductase